MEGVAAALLDGGGTTTTGGVVVVVGDARTGGDDDEEEDDELDGAAVVDGPADDLGLLPLPLPDKLGDVPEPLEAMVVLEPELDAAGDELAVTIEADDRG